MSRTSAGPARPPRTLTNFALLAGLCLLAASSAAARQSDDRESLELHGPVKSIEVYSVDYAMKDGRVERGPRRLRQAYAFNREGHATEHVSYDGRGQVERRHVYKFDAQGRAAGREDYGPNPAAAPTRHVFVRDEANRRVEVQIYDADDAPPMRHASRYDANGRVVEEAHYTPTGELGVRTVYAYDGEGRPLSRVMYDGEGRILSKFVLSYDGEGRPAETLHYDGERLRFKVSTRFDERGRMLEVVTDEVDPAPNVLVSSQGPQPGRVVYEYDDRQRTRVETTYGPDDSFRRRVRIAHDERGSEVSRTEYQSDGTPAPVEMHFYDDISKPDGPHRGALRGFPLNQFEYDARGNWTKKTYLIRPPGGGPPRPYREEERVIVYY